MKCKLDPYYIMYTYSKKIKKKKKRKRKGSETCTNSLSQIIYKLLVFDFCNDYFTSKSDISKRKRRKEKAKILKDNIKFKMYIQCKIYV